MLARRRTFFFPVAIITLFLFGRPVWTAYGIGLAFILAGEAIRFWAAGHIRKCVEVTIDGPFGWMRNPLYAGSFLITFGYCVIASSVVLGVVVMLMFCVFHGAAVLSEERYLTRLFGNEFLAYCQSVPRFFPKPPRNRGQGKFSLRLVWSNNEHISALCAGVVVLLFALRVLLR